METKSVNKRGILECGNSEYMERIHAAEVDAVSETFGDVLGRDGMFVARISGDGEPHHALLAAGDDFDEFVMSNADVRTGVDTLLLIDDKSTRSVIERCHGRFRADGNEVVTDVELRQLGDEVAKSLGDMDDPHDLSEAELRDLFESEERIVPMDELAAEIKRNCANHRQEALFDPHALAKFALRTDQAVYNVKTGICIVPDTNDDGELNGAQYGRTPLDVLLAAGNDGMPHYLPIDTIAPDRLQGIIEKPGNITDIHTDELEGSNTLEGMTELMDNDGDGWCLAKPYSIAAAAGIVPERYKEVSYHPENAGRHEPPFGWDDFLEAAKGNLAYAMMLVDRAEWTYPSTMVDEDLREGEICELDGQFALSNGFGDDIDEKDILGVDPSKEMEKGQDMEEQLNKGTISVCVGNYGYYNEGDLRDAWIELPKSDEEIRNFLTERGLQDAEHEEIYISDYENVPFDLNDVFNQYTRLEDVNLLANQLATMSEDTIEDVEDYLEGADHPKDIVELMNLIEIADDGDLPYFAYDCQGISPEERYGYTLVDNNQELNSVLQNDPIAECSFDFEAYGRDNAINDGVTLLKNGYIPNERVDLDTYDREELQAMYGHDNKERVGADDLLSKRDEIHERSAARSASHELQDQARASVDAR